MLRGLGSWLGLERAGEERLLPPEERSSSAEEEEEAEAGAEPAVQGSEQAELQVDSEALLSQAKGLGSYGMHNCCVFHKMEIFIQIAQSFPQF